MIKRFLSLIFCLCLLCTATVALADDEITYPGTDGSATTTFGNEVGVNITAIATDTAITNTEEKYSVEIVWGDMAFAWGLEHDADAPLTWDPATHQYVKEEDNTVPTDNEKGWYMLNTNALTVAYPTQLAETDTFVETTQDMVMVFNHSNKQVKATIVIDNDEDKIADAGITAGLGGADNASAEAVLEVTVGDVYAEASALVKQVVLSDPGDATKIPTDAAAVVAKLTVTISKVVNTENNTENN